MTLVELRDKIDKIIQEHPSWANVNRIGRVLSENMSGTKKQPYCFSCGTGWGQRRD